MSRPGYYFTRNWPPYGTSREFALSFHNPPILSLATRLSLLGYLGSMAMTQTVYGWPFMPVRWMMLGLLAASSTADLILVSRHAEFRIRPGNGLVLSAYLLLTFATVIYAENWMFSGMRWASHALMLVVFMITLPQLATLGQIRQMMRLLRYMMGFLVVISWILPTYDNARNYQGAMGNANTMGDIAFITALLFLQNWITEKLSRYRCFSGVMAFISTVTIWKTGARSAMIAFLAGVVLLCYYYRKSMRGAALVGILAGSIAMVSFPQVPERIFHFAQKTDRYMKSTGPMQSRIPVWSAAYEGFKARPLTGWGFGADSSMTKAWAVQLTSLGTVERDVVNDFLFMMEGGGMIGLCSYLILIFLVLKQRPSRPQVSALQNFSRDQQGVRGDMEWHHIHAGLFIISVSLIVLFQIDNTALSAGNLISLTLWLCTGCAAVLRHEISRRSEY